MKRKKLEAEEPPPADLAAMTLEQLEAEDDKYCHHSLQGRLEHARLVAERDRAQSAILAFSERRRAITSAIVRKLQLESEKAGKP